MTASGVALSGRNRRILLAARPKGLPTASDWSTDELALAPLDDGDVLVKTVPNFSDFQYQIVADGATRVGGMVHVENYEYTADSKKKNGVPEGRLEKLPRQDSRIFPDTVRDVTLPYVMVDVRVEDSGGDPVSGAVVNVVELLPAPFEFYSGNQWSGGASFHGGSAVTDAGGHAIFKTLPGSLPSGLQVVPPASLPVVVPTTFLGLTSIEVVLHNYAVVESVGDSTGSVSVAGPDGTTLVGVSSSSISGNALPSGAVVLTGLLAYQVHDMAIGSSIDLILGLPAGSAPNAVFKVQDGVYSAQIEGYAYGPNTLSQLIATTSGQSYTLSFWYNAVGKSANGFNVTWNGATVFSVTNQMTSGFQHITANVLGSGSDALVFTAYNDRYNTMLDNVSVSAVASAVPEPATWAMMIIGFGATGVMIRASRRRTVAA